MFTGAVRGFLRLSIFFILFTPKRFRTSVFYLVEQDENDETAAVFTGQRFARVVHVYMDELSRPAIRALRLLLCHAALVPADAARSARLLGRSLLGNGFEDNGWELPPCPQAAGILSAPLS
jgi:hypothetical protein